MPCGNATIKPPFLRGSTETGSPKSYYIPPEPVREMPPGPKQVKKDKSVPRLAQLEIETPKIVMPGTNLMTAAPLALPNPRPPIKKPPRRSARPRHRPRKC